MTDPPPLTRTGEVVTFDGRTEDTSRPPNKISRVGLGGVWGELSWFIFSSFSLPSQLLQDLDRVAHDFLDDHDASPVDWHVVVSYHHGVGAFTAVPWVVVPLFESFGIVSYRSMRVDTTYFL